MCVSICRVGQNHIYIRCVYGIFGREFTIYTVIYGVYIRFWPTLSMCMCVRICVGMRILIERYYLRVCITSIWSTIL